MSSSVLVSVISRPVFLGVAKTFTVAGGYCGIKARKLSVGIITLSHTFSGNMVGILLCQDGPSRMILIIQLIGLS